MLCCTLKFSIITLPVPLARNSKLLLLNVVLTTLPAISISPVLSLLAVIGLLTIRFVVVKVPLIVVFCKLVIPPTVKLLSTTALSCILTTPVPLARSSKLAFELVVVM